MNDEQRKYFKEKSHFENNVKITAEMARQKVRELEMELEKQSKFFEKQQEKYDLEIQMLKEFNLGFEKDYQSKDQQIQMMIDQVNKFKKEKKDAMSIVKQREIELSRANKRVGELQKQIGEYQYTQNKILNQREMPRAPSAQREGAMNRSLIASRGTPGSAGG